MKCGDSMGFMLWDTALCTGVRQPRPRHTASYIPISSPPSSALLYSHFPRGDPYTLRLYSYSPPALLFSPTHPALPSSAAEHGFRNEISFEGIQHHQGPVT